MSTTYTDEQFIAAIRKAVEIRGEDYVYPSKEEHPEYYIGIGASPSCRYQLDDGTPACIVGLALHQIDPGLVPEPGSTTLAGGVLRQIGFSRKVSEAATTAQLMQDDDASWGSALEAFEDEIGVRGSN